MFQNVNVAKSAPFALLTIYQKSLYPPKVFKLPPFRQIRKIRRPFFDLNNEKWNPLNSQRIAQKSLTSPPLAINHAKYREIRSIR